MKGHIAIIHGGMKPFHCYICNAAFGEKGSLKKHVTIAHERKKQFQCDICNADFGGKGNLNAHVTKVHEGKSNSYVIFVILNLEKTNFSRNMLQQSMKEVNHTYVIFAMLNLHQNLPRMDTLQ